MSENSMLIGVHAFLFLAQIGAAGLAIGIDPKWSAMSVPISLAQAWFPKPAWSQQRLNTRRMLDAKKPK